MGDGPNYPTPSGEYISCINYMGIRHTIMNQHYFRGNQMYVLQSGEGNLCVFRANRRIKAK